MLLGCLIFLFICKGVKANLTQNDLSQFDAASTRNLMVLGSATGYMMNLYGNETTHALLCDIGSTTIHATATFQYPATPQMIKYAIPSGSDSGTHFYASGISYSVECHNESTQTIYLCYGSVACTVDSGREILPHGTVGMTDIQIQHLHLYDAGLLHATATVTYWQL